ncbi:MAG: hypothetical protein ACFBRM_13195 [Pikeienuella sp.]
MRLPLLVAAILVIAPVIPALSASTQTTDDVAAARTEPVWVQFRELFSGIGKPTDRAVELSGNVIEIEGFLAPPPSYNSPFLVFVGAPTVKCPYCSSINDEEHLPYILVYPNEGDSFPRTQRHRLKVVGRIMASHDHEPIYGLHNDIRILDAQVTLDDRTPGRFQRARNVRTDAASGAQAGIRKFE